MSKLSLEEKETIILFNEKDKEAEIFTYNRPLIAKLKKLSQERPDEVQFKRDNGDGGLTFIVPKNLISITARTKRSYTSEERQIMSERMKKLRAEGRI